MQSFVVPRYRANGGKDNMMNSRTKGFPAVAQFVVLSAVLAVGGLRGLAGAECWQTGSYLPGFDGGVVAITRLGTAVYVGGVFTHVNGIEVNGIAKWDGASWSALGTGLAGGVYALAVDNSGNLYAGGGFAGKVAKWDGSSWSALGSGVSGSVVLALAADSSGNLYAGGVFHHAGGVQARSLAKWDGASWSAVGTTGDYGRFSALAVDSSGDLLAAKGGFPEETDPFRGPLGRWDGTQWWSQSGGTAGQSVSALAADSVGNVYAAGGYGVAKRIGSDYWSELGTGMNVGATALAVDSSGVVYATGTFKQVGGSPLNNIQRWDGTSWSGLGTGVSGTVNALTVDDDGIVYAGGLFAAAGGNPAANFAEFQPACPTCNNAFGAQNITIKPKVMVTNVGQAGNERVEITGEFINATPFGMLNPVANGARLVIQNAAGITEADVTASGGAPVSGMPLGWTLNASGTKWTFRGAPRAPENGIARMSIEDRNSQSPNQVRVKIRATRGKYPIVAGDSPIKATVVLGGQDASLAGQCGETVFTPADCSLNSAGTKLRCQQ